MGAPLPIVRIVPDLRARIAAWRKAGASIGLVPTMGALHEGHLSLVRAAKAQCDCVAASVFVNPKQFAPHEDFERYPRNEAEDATLLASAGCDLLYAPSPEAMYPPGFATSVSVAEISAPLEGEMRPHFFGGVATVVSKLLLQSLPDKAFFGEKDYQQLLVIQHMARDLDIPVDIQGLPTVREPDGLALSSRNFYLSPQERLIAGALNLIMREAISAFHAGAPIDALEQEALQRLMRAGFDKVDYIVIRDAQSLAPLADRHTRARILAAAWLGKTRLIDNMAV